MKNKKIIIIMFIVAILNIIISNFSFATEIKNTTYTIQYNKNENRYISYNGVSQRFFDYYYLNESNQKLDTYCINLSQDGAEKTENGYIVNAIEYIKDQNIINIMNNGYPHKSYKELGLEDENQAKFATQFALWIYTNNLDINKIGDINDKSGIVKQAIINIYNSKNITRNLDTKFNINQGKTEIIKIKDKNYYKIRFNLDIGKDILEIKRNIDEKNIRIVDSKLNDLNRIDNISEFYVLYPVELIHENTNLNLNFITKYKNLNVKLGRPIDSKMQDVALVLPEYEEKEFSKDFTLEFKKLELQINKKDTYGKPIENVKFKLYNSETNEIIGEYVTDKNGIINIDFRRDLKINNDIYIRIEEINVPEGYKLLETPLTTKLEYGKCVNVDIENEKIPDTIVKRIELPKTGM